MANFRIFREWQQHAYLALVAPIPITKCAHEVALFQESAEDGIGGAHGREQQMACGHVRRRPKGNEGTDVDRMPHQPVEARRCQRRRAHRAAAGGIENLPQPDQRQIVRAEPGKEHHQPAKPEHQQNDQPHHRLLYGPDRMGDRPPEPKEQRQRQAGYEHVGAAFDGIGDEPGPPTFKAGSGHDAVLNGELSQQENIDNQRYRPRSRNARVDRRWDQIGHEADAIEGRCRGNCRCADAVKQSDPWHGVSAAPAPAAGAGSPWTTS